MLPGTTEGMGHVCFFRQALALDERRVKFLPEYAWGGSTISREQPHNWKHTPPTSLSQSESPHPRIPNILEVWFAGTHSDM
jgi:hypothetical protein